MKAPIFQFETSLKSPELLTFFGFLALIAFLTFSQKMPALNERPLSNAILWNVDKQKCHTLVKVWAVFFLMALIQIPGDQ